MSKNNNNNQSSCTLSYEQQNVHIFVDKNIQTEKKEKYKKQAVELCLEPYQISTVTLRLCL